MCFTVNDLMQNMIFVLLIKAVQTYCMNKQFYKILCRKVVQEMFGT